VAYIYHQLDRHREGIEKVKEYLERSPDKSYWYREWVELAIYAGDTVDAERAIEQALRRVDDHEERRRLLIDAASQYHYFAEDRDRAEELYRSALEVEANEAEDEALRGLGWVLLARRDYQGAEETFRRAMMIDPDDWQPRWGVLVSLSAARRYDDVIAAAKEMLAILDKKPGLVEKHPMYLWLYPSWVEAAILLGDETETERAIEEGLRRCTNDRQKTRLLLQVALSYLKLGNWTKSAESLDRATELYGGVDEDDDSYEWVLAGFLHRPSRRGDA